MSEFELAKCIDNWAKRKHCQRDNALIAYLLPILYALNIPFLICPFFMCPTLLQCPICIFLTNRVVFVPKGRFLVWLRYGLSLAWALANHVTVTNLPLAWHWQLEFTGTLRPTLTNSSSRNCVASWWLTAPTWKRLINLKLAGPGRAAAAPPSWTWSPARGQRDSDRRTSTVQPEIQLELDSERQWFGIHCSIIIMMVYHHMPLELDDKLRYQRNHGCHGCVRSLKDRD